MSIQINAEKITKNVMAFFARTEYRRFSDKRKRANCIQEELVEYMEKKSPNIIPREKRRGRVYFPDDPTLPSKERGNVVSSTLEQKLGEEEYKEIIAYRDCYNNQDYLAGQKRRDEETIVIVCCK